MSRAPSELPPDDASALLGIPLWALPPQNDGMVNLDSALAAYARLRWPQYPDFRRDYVNTLREWRRGLNAATDPMFERHFAKLLADEAGEVARWYALNEREPTWDDFAGAAPEAVEHLAAQAEARYGAGRPGNARRAPA